MATVAPAENNWVSEEGSKGEAGEAKTTESTTSSSLKSKLNKLQNTASLVGKEQVLTKKVFGKHISHSGIMSVARV